MITRSRRSKAEVQVVKDAIQRVLESEHPMTVRQVFYQLVSLGAIAKTETEYKHTVVRLLTQMRRTREIPFGWIADNTRWMRKPLTYSSLEDALQATAEAYRTALWNDADVYIEVWLEKDALAGVLYQVTNLWDVPLMVTRGYPSLSYLYGAAEAIMAQSKPTYLYYFGDRDPSGVDIPRIVEERIHEFAPDAEVYFERVAVTEQQITELGLPTRPTKRTDSRSKNFEGESVEVDAIPPSTLRQLVEDCITQHIDPALLERTKAIEAAERQTLMQIASRPVEYTESSGSVVLRRRRRSS